MRNFTEKGYLFTRFNASDFDQSISGPLDGFGDHVSRFGLSFSADNICLTFLFSLRQLAWSLERNDLLNSITCSFSVLLSNLFLFNGTSEFFSKSHVSDGDIFKLNIEFICTFKQVFTNAR